MKTVNFIQAVEYAKRGKEVYINTYERFNLCYNKRNGVIIIRKRKYNDFLNGELIDDRYTFNDIEFYLNKWIVKDEEEVEEGKAFPWTPDEIKLNK